MSMPMPGAQENPGSPDGGRGLATSRRSPPPFPPPAAVPLEPSSAPGSRLTVPQVRQAGACNLAPWSLHRARAWAADCVGALSWPELRLLHPGTLACWFVAGGTRWRIRRMEGLLKARTRAQGPRRAADKGRSSSAPGGWRGRAVPLSTRQHRPPSHEVRGRLSSGTPVCPASGGAFRVSPRPERAMGAAPPGRGTQASAAASPSPWRGKGPSSGGAAASAAARASPRAAPWPSPPPPAGGGNSSPSACSSSRHSPSTDS